MTPLAGLVDLATARKRREAGRAARERATALIRKAGAVCLGYPDEAFGERLALVRGAANELPERHAEAARTLRRFVTYAESQDPYELAAAYVETFDQRNRASLYLTWWTAGDTRNRGGQIVRFIEAYREAGCEYGGAELPDHLPVVLDFAACAGAAAAEVGSRLLAEHRPGLEKLHHALDSRARPTSGEPAAQAYAKVVADVLATVLETVPAEPPPSAADLLPVVPIPLAFGDLS